MSYRKKYEGLYDKALLRRMDRLSGLRTLARYCRLRRLHDWANYKFLVAEEGY